MALYGSTSMKYRNKRLLETILNEAYVGKSDVLHQIEEKFGELRANCKMTDDINRSKAVLEINKLFEEQFGCKLFALKIDKSNQINAYTQVLAMNFKVAEEVNVSSLVTATASKGYYFKQPNEICIIMHMYYGLLMSDEFTNSELVAVCLHEIGHNFADCLYDTIKYANRNMMLAYKSYLKAAIIFSAIYALLTFGLGSGYFIQNLKNYREFNRSFESKYKYEKRLQNKRYSKLRGLISGLNGKFTDYKDFINELLNRLSIDGFSYEKSIEKYLNSSKGQKAKEEEFRSIGRQNEVFADKFAGVYGYGVEQATALLKMQKLRSRADLKLDGDENNEALNRGMLRLHNFDCHPQVIQRSIEEIKLYERELQKEDIDPRVKKELQSQIEQLKEIMNKSITEYDKLSKNQDAKANYNKYIRDNEPDAVPEDLENAIEDSLDKLIEEDKLKRKRGI